MFLPAELAEDLEQQATDARSQLASAAAAARDEIGVAFGPATAAQPAAAATARSGDPLLGAVSDAAQPMEQVT